MDSVAGTSGRTVVMGVVNVTPDSFSDGGHWFEPAAAIKHGLLLLEQGADLVDVGGESTRPGAPRVDPAEELRRVIPVVRELAAAGARVSVDTMRAPVAEAAVAVGACLINDVSGALADPAMAACVAELQVPYVAMHWRAHSTEMSQRAVYQDVVAEVVAELQARVDALIAAGVRPEAIILDPGLGFAKNAEHNWTLLAQLDQLQALGFPLLIGASRKRFLGMLLAGPEQEPVPVTARDGATAAITTLAAQAGAWGVRVHEVPLSAAAVRVVQRLNEETR